MAQGEWRLHPSLVFFFLVLPASKLRLLHFYPRSLNVAGGRYRTTDIQSLLALTLWVSTAW